MAPTNMAPTKMPVAAAALPKINPASVSNGALVAPCSTHQRARARRQPGPVMGCRIGAPMQGSTPSAPLCRHITLLRPFLTRHNRAE
jgi:hypothetical protein